MSLKDKKLGLIREQWNARVNDFLNELSVAVHKRGEKQPGVSPELKVKHKKTGILYTVDSLSMRDVVLRSPEGKKFMLDSSDFERDYEIS